MNDQVTFNIYQIAHFKNWVKGRFIQEIDAHNLSADDALAWSIALIEMGVCIQQIALGKAVLPKDEGVNKGG